MTIRFHMISSTDNICDCLIKITDNATTREFIFPCVSETSHINVDICSSVFDLTVIPITVSTDEAFQGIESKTLMDKLGLKVLKKLTDITKNYLYRLSCTYRINNTTEVKDIFLECREFIIGSTKLYNIIEILPLFCMYYEVKCNGTAITPIRVKGKNRKQLIKFTRGFSLTSLLLYPVNMIRMRIISTEGYLTRALKRFYSLSPEKRRKKQKKWDNI